MLLKWAPGVLRINRCVALIQVTASSKPDGIADVFMTSIKYSALAEVDMFIAVGGFPSESDGRLAESTRCSILT